MGKEIQHQAGAVEVVMDESEKAENEIIKTLKKEVKKDSDLTAADVKKLVYLIAKKLKILE